MALFPDFLIGPEAMKYFEKGYEHQVTGELDKAVYNYKKSLEIEPTAEGYTFLGWAYSFMGEYRKAINECLKAIEIDPDFGNPYNDIGSYLTSLGEFDEAVQWLNNAKNAARYANPEFPCCNLGRIYENLGKIDLAIREYKAALSHNERYTPARQALKRLEALLN
ncbi:tetratricopeptide repeat protein [candidate division KSB1 bacterium]